MAVVSERLFKPPMDPRYITVLLICGTISLVCFAAGLRLAWQHIRAGQKITGTLAPDERSFDLATLVLSVPLFALLSFGSVILVEMVPIWHFLQILVLAATFAQVPALFFSAMGGRVPLQRRLQAVAAGEGCKDLLLYGQPPCCCLRCFFPWRQPRPTDLPKLRFLIMQLVFIQPIVAFFNLTVNQESLLGAGFVNQLKQYRSTSSIVRLLSQLVCMAACKGLVEMINALNPKAQDSLALMKILRYCQTFLLGMNIIPTVLAHPLARLWGATPLENGFTLSTLELSTFAHSIAVCLGTLLSFAAAQSAFPVDASKNPNEFESDTTGGAALSEAMLSRDPL